jgi:hypothetical protein
VPFTSLPSLAALALLAGAPAASWAQPSPMSRGAPPGGPALGPLHLRVELGVGRGSFRFRNPPPDDDTNTVTSTGVLAVVALGYQVTPAFAVLLGSWNFVSAGGEDVGIGARFGPISLNAVGPGARWTFRSINVHVTQTLSFAWLYVMSDRGWGTTGTSGVFGQTTVVKDWRLSEAWDMGISAGAGYGRMKEPFRSWTPVVLAAMLSAGYRI